ncbi:MAG TPA: hypothetical protein VFB44_01635 [Thermoleophilaceae bacterium]|nr:hypothetical protein [Thermoleophilaceae bacterium]
MTGSKRTATRVAVAGALPPPNWPRSGFNPDHDHKVSDEIRFVQLTPPARPARSHSGPGVVDTPPGSLQGLQLVVSDIRPPATSSPGVART